MNASRLKFVSTITMFFLVLLVLGISTPVYADIIGESDEREPITPVTDYPWAMMIVNLKIKDYILNYMIKTIN